ncbi:MAG: hypothetical protein ACX930_00765 [Erythrobacter sp.]
MTGAQEFAYHRGIAPMMWVLFALSLIELVAVHIFVALKWPLIGWTLTVISAIGVVWILLWIRSFRTRPHVLTEDRLLLRFGNLKSVELDLANIACVRRGWEQGALDQKGIINLSGLAYPNRCLEFVEPIERGRERVFIRLDEPEQFDAALEARAIAFV